MGKRFESWLTRARSGDRDAMTDVGVAYRMGVGVPQSLPRALLWYRRAAKLGEPTAHANLSNCYLYGEGVRRDLRKSFRSALRAAELGHESSRIRVACAYLDGQGTRRNHRLGRKLLEDLEGKGWWRARRELARRLCDGECLPKDEALGLRLFRKGVRQGDADCLRDLGTYYHGDEHGPAGYRRAISYYQRAARMGSVFAMIRLHECFDEGHDRAVRKDARRACAWLRKAVEAPYDEEFSSWAWFLLAERLIEGSGAREDLPQALRLLRRAARDEYGPAFHALAELALEGKGMRRDLRRAREWMSKARWLGQDTRALERRRSAAGRRRGAHKRTAVARRT